MRTRQQVWLPFRHNCSHEFATISAATAMPMTSVCEAPSCRHEFEAVPYVWHAQKSHRMFGQGGKSSSAYRTAGQLLLEAAGRLSGSNRELQGDCPSLPKACRVLPGAPAGSLPGACRGPPGARREPAGRRPEGGRQYFSLILGT